MIRLTLAAAIIALSLPADAQTLQCGDAIEIAAELESRWGERLQGRGIMQNGNMATLFADDGGDSWTMLVVTKDGTGCFVATGTGWEWRKKGIDGWWKRQCQPLKSCAVSMI